MAPLLVLVTDRELAGARLFRAVEDAVAAGVDRVQVRERQLSGSELFEHVERVAAAARAGAQLRSGRVEVVVNRFVDIAIAAGADGAHLGFDAMSAADARALLGPEKILSIACHTSAEAQRAGALPIDDAQLAPIFPPRSKPASRPALGLEVLRSTAAGQLSIVAQGGIDPEKAAACVEAGAAGVAVTGALLMTETPGEAAAAFRRALDTARPKNPDG